MDLYDLTIIGGGPAGLFTVFYSGMRALKTKLIEAKPQTGGIVSYFYPEKTIYDLGGIPAIQGDRLIEHLSRQARTFDPDIILGQQIAHMKRLENGAFELTSTDGQRHATRKIILAVGSGVFEVNKLENPDAAQFENKSLFYAVRRPEQFAGRSVVISGGGDAALDWANQLAPICRKTTIVYRQEQFQHVLEHSLDELHRQSVDVLLSSEIESLSGEQGRLRSLTIRNVKTGQVQELATDALIVNHGFKFGLGPLEQWGMEIRDNGIVVDRRMETSIPGIFAVGNAAVYDQKLYLITAGFVEGPTAVNSIKHDLDPQAPSQAMVSTHHHFFTHKSR